MELVVDANVLVAGFLRAATTRELLLDERLVLWAPEYSLTETERVLTGARLRRKLGGPSAADVKALLSHLTSRIRVVAASIYRARLADALRIAPHQEDAPYLALALHLRMPLWSNDTALKAQQLIAVYTTEEVLARLQTWS